MKVMSTNFTLIFQDSISKIHKTYTKANWHAITDEYWKGLK